MHRVRSAGDHDADGTGTPATRAPGATFLRATVALAAGGVFALFLGLSFFAFPSADDFCYAARVAAAGFGEAQVHWYATWSGRYASNAAVSAAAAGPDLVGTYPAWAIASLVATLLGFAAVASSVGAGLFRGSSLLLGALVACVVYITLVPDPAQTFFWMTGSLTYQLGNVATLFLAAALVAMERGRPRGLGARFLLRMAAALAAIVAIGTNEVSLVLVMSILFLGTLASFRLRRPSRGSWAALLLIGLVAAAISAAAPGNFARAGSLAHDGMLRLPTAAALLALIPWAVLRLMYWLSNLAVLASAILLWYVTHDRLRGVFFVDGRMDRRWLALPVAWIAVMVLLHAVGFAVNRHPLPERAESVVAIAFVLGVYPTVLALLHALRGDRPAPDPVRAGRAGTVLLVIALLGHPTVFEACKDVYRGIRYAKEMRMRFDVLAARAGDRTVDLRVESISRPPRTLFATDIGTDPANFRNRCLANYYAVRSIALGPASR